jgi:1,4-dihydroxy-2-naphthoate octaprenyltransferase
MKHWILAARPKTLFAAFAPVLIGVSMASQDMALEWFYVVVIFAGAFAVQIGTNFCNDYFDFKQGADTEDRQGPTRAVQAGLITPKAMLVATILMFVLAAIFCGILVARAGMPMVIIGVCSIICGIWYTAGRYSLAYLGLADVFVLVFFGPVAVGGTYYVLTNGGWNEYVAVAGLGPGLIATALLAVNNLRDIDQDRAANKRTLAVRFGRVFARFEYIACITTAGLIPAFFAMQAFEPHPLLAWLIYVIALPAFIQVCKGRTGAELNPVLGKTALMLLLYSVLFSVGYCLA